MSKHKPTTSSRAKKKREASLVRSSAVECLTFVAGSGQGAVYANENVGLSPKMMGAIWCRYPHDQLSSQNAFADYEVKRLSYSKFSNNCCRRLSPDANAAQVMD